MRDGGMPMFIATRTFGDGGTARIGLFMLVKIIPSNMLLARLEIYNPIGSALFGGQITGRKTPAFLALTLGA